MKVLVLRPQPGADETAARARAIGLEPVVAPLFAIRALAWSPPDASEFDAVLLTSANAARHGGDGMTPFMRLPCYAVGERTADAARAAGFADVRTGPSDGAALVAMARQEGAEALLHLGGRDHVALDGVARIPVYAAEAAGALPTDAERAVVLIHSARAAARFADLAGDRRGAFRIAAISAEAAAAAGPGWRTMAIAAAPRDQALLELAAKLCQTAGA
ncbi:MAG TPA: uroporphyrinogen-III synthase [Allosphingosinicella sp.]|nr:uroporphyrinogen-III synthase [Allosphingosinicella sp.]